MSWTCDRCGTENKPTFKFCFGCGDAKPGQPAPASIKPDPVAALPPIEPVGKPKNAETSSPKAVPKSVRAVDEETGWRCHECWKLNSERLAKCGECGTHRNASERSDLRDRIFGIFGAIGKWPIVVIALMAIVAGFIWLFIYLNPKHGERISAPAGLESEIRASLDQASTRKIEESAYYSCYSTTVAGRNEPGGYAAVVTLVARSTNISNANFAVGPDNDRYWQFIAHREGYGWKVGMFRVADSASILDPCTVK